ncbi:hypothetical protein ATCC90586_003869 [Pythium insidiosum]|nr:hypothetical protein ATCC90586_003869 [Pythium insidiosum]
MEEATPVESVEIDPTTARSVDADQATAESRVQSTRQRYLAMSASRSELFDFQDDFQDDEQGDEQGDGQSDQLQKQWEPADNQFAMASDEMSAALDGDLYPAEGVPADAYFEAEEAQDSSPSAIEMTAPALDSPAEWDTFEAPPEAKEIGNTPVETETLAIIWQYFHEKILENQCTSQSQEIREFVDSYLSPAQQRRQLPAIVESLARELAREATARGEDVSLDVQSSLCILEQLSLSLGRASPFEDMYTSDEEELLEQLATTETNNGA